MKGRNLKVMTFLMSVIIGLLVVGNININNDTKYIQLSTKEYQQAYAERNQLLSTISKLKHSNDEIKNKINNYTYGGKQDEKVLEDMKQEIDYNKMTIGFDAVKGPGVKILLSDGVDTLTEKPKDDTLLYVKTLHDNDMMKLINELKLAGAQAIAINGQRVLPNSEILCGWAFLNINGIKTPGPFTVDAIGDKDVLCSVLERNDSYVKALRNRDISVSILKEDELHINGYSGDESFNNLK